MQKDFWLNRWQTREIGWHQDEVEPALIKWTETLKPCRILVPLCGKSLDLTHLMAEKFEVIGVELSSIACDEFFSENKIPFKKTTESKFTVYRADHLTLYCGDFFNTSPDLIGRIDAVYDRAALIAMPPELRPKYTSHLKTLIGPSLKTKNFQMLQIILRRFPHDLGGPPFSIPENDLNAYYAKDFQFKLVSEEPVEAKAPPGSKTHELVLVMTASRGS